MTGHLLRHVSDCLNRTGWAADRWRPAFNRDSTNPSAEGDTVQADLRAQYHLGRGRRARDTGRPDCGAREARRALAVSPRNPWAYALLGQCLSRSGPSHLDAARKALEQALTLDPTNGYFVRLLLEVLHRQHDTPARMELLTRAWWAGAPVDRWLPDGPPQPRPTRALQPDDRAAMPSVPEPAVSQQTNRQAVLA